MSCRWTRNGLLILIKDLENTDQHYVNNEWLIRMRENKVMKGVQTFQIQFREGPLKNMSIRGSNPHEKKLTQVYLI